MPIKIEPIGHYHQVKKNDLIPITTGFRPVLATVSRVYKDRFEYKWHNGNQDRKGTINNLNDVVLFRGSHGAKDGKLLILLGSYAYTPIEFGRPWVNPPKHI